MYSFKRKKKKLNTGNNFLFPLTNKNKKTPVSVVGSEFNTIEGSGGDMERNSQPSSAPSCRTMKMKREGEGEGQGKREVAAEQRGYVYIHTKYYCNNKNRKK
jgi:hypothetical protein